MKTLLYAISRAPTTEALKPRVNRRQNVINLAEYSGLNKTAAVGVFIQRVVTTAVNAKFGVGGG